MPEFFKKVVFENDSQRRLAFCSLYFFLSLLYVIFFGQQLLSSLHYPDVLIAPIMSLGSFVAGSTFLGGGAVAFPAMTKILGSDPQTAKIFSFAIQSVGMSSASLYILSRISVFPIKLIAIYISCAVAGLLFCTVFLQNIFASADIRIAFTVFVVCFFIIYLQSHSSISAKGDVSERAICFTHRNITLDQKSIAVTVVCAFIGGTISGFIGSGADLLIFCLLTLYFHVGIKLATQLSVITMAAVSLFGIAIESLKGNSLPSEVTTLWIIAAPVVLFGAPLGALFCGKIKSRNLILFISFIICVEVISTLLLVDIPVQRYLYYFLGLLFTLIFLTILAMHSPYKSELQ